MSTIPMPRRAHATRLLRIRAEKNVAVLWLVGCFHCILALPWSPTPAMIVPALRCCNGLDDTLFIERNHDRFVF